jgi:hypothetical protein
MSAIDRPPICHILIGAADVLEARHDLLDVVKAEHAERVRSIRARQPQFGIAEHLR